MPGSSGTSGANGSSGQDRGAVLVVDDNATLLRAIALLLGMEGYRIVHAKDAEEALVHADEQRFDVVVSDFRLPGSDGLELARRLRSAEPRLGVILCSGNPSTELLRYCREEERVVYLGKPFLIPTLVAAVRDLSEP